MIGYFNKLSGWLRSTFEADGSRILAMEGVRGVAVLLVFLHHYTTQALQYFGPTGTTEVIARAVQRYGNLGVELFFVLSGYLIYGLLVAKRTSFGVFMKRRAVRIYPAFLVAFSIALVHDLPKLMELDFVDALGRVAVNLLLLPGLLPIEPILAVAWSLSYELFFYCATAAVVIWLGLRQRSSRERVSVVLAFSVVFSLLCLAEVRGVPVRMLPFFAGMLLFEMTEAKRWSLPSAVGLCAPVLAFVLGETVAMPPLPRELLHTVAFFLMCAACFRSSGGASHVFSWRPLRWLGNMSYSYYLMHGFATVAGVQLLDRFVDANGGNTFFWLILPPLFVASLIPSAVLYLVVEKPISLQSRVTQTGARGLPVRESVGG